MVKKAIVAVEDKRYFDHGGVDLISLLSVLKGGLNRGGSTIRCSCSRTWSFTTFSSATSSHASSEGRRVRFGSFDGAVGKDELLAAYLNQIEFGGREIVGLYRAARHYFRKEPKDLNLYEAATLAGRWWCRLRRASTRSRSHAGASSRARGLVLRLMVEQGRIEEGPCDRTPRPAARPPAGIQDPEPGLHGMGRADLGAEACAAGRNRSILRHDRSALPAPRGAPPRRARGERRGAGGIRCWSRDGSPGPGPGDGRHGRLVAAALQQCRQGPGAAGLDREAAAPGRGLRGRQGATAQVVDLPITEGWPANGSVGYRGDTTLKEAFARSRNAAAVRLTRELGIDAVAEAGRRLGIEPGSKPDSTVALRTFSSMSSP